MYRQLTHQEIMSELNRLQLEEGLSMKQVALKLSIPVYYIRSLKAIARGKGDKYPKIDRQKWFWILAARLGFKVAPLDSIFIED